MAVRKILLLGNENLYKISEEVKKEELAVIKVIVEDLHDTLMDFREKYGSGRAIAAPQIGCFKRIIYMNIDKPVTLINPKIEYTNNEMITVWDDCMSFPDLLVKVKRYKKCKIFFKDLNWNTIHLELEDDLSELLQHEYDHLDGILALQKGLNKKSFRLKNKDLKTPKKIGILGGISHKSTVKYYELILKKYYLLKEDYHYPEIIINSLDFQKFTNFEDKGDRKGYLKYIIEGIQSLEKAGAEFIIMAANSPHSVYNEVRNHISKDMISIVDVVGEYAVEKKYKKLLLLGIKYTMESDFYQSNFKKMGIELFVPSEQERILINDIIFKELSIGAFNQDSKEQLLHIIKKYDVEGVVLGCTELPLIINKQDLDIDVIDTIELHVNKILNHSLGIEE